MNRATFHLLAITMLGATLAAQSPRKTPPWWGVQDEVTVSLYWNFSGSTPLQPTTAVVPSWYNPVVTAFTQPSNVTRIATLNGHTDVLGIVGTGTPQTALLKLKVDNDPHLDWVKIFQFQFDSFEGASGTIRKAIEQDLAQYKRTIVSETSVPLGSGWTQVTIEAQLIPQPGDETIDWAMTETALGTVAIDDVFVSSKCVKVDDDSNDAFGRVVESLDLNGITGLECVGAAVTEGPGPLFAKQFWISTRAATVGAPHAVLRVDNSGPGPIVVGTTALLGDTLTTAPRGGQDLAIETVVQAGGTTQQFVCVLLDRRPTAGSQGVVIRRIDAQTGSLQTAANLSLIGFPPLPLNQDMGLAFDPSGNGGAGTFWVSGTDQNGRGLLLEFDRTTGVLLTVVGQNPAATTLPPDCAGIGYDDVLGNFYGFSHSILASPGGPVQANGFEWSGYGDPTNGYALTGNRFCGDLTIQNGTGPRGGEAVGLEVYRSRRTPDAELRLVCLVKASPTPGVTRYHVRELAGPFGFGWSQFGRCKMRGGVPFLGSNNFQVALTGVPDALFGMMYLGFSNTTYLGLPLPFPLATAGMPESSLSISLDVSGPLTPPTGPGEFVVPVPIPSSAALGYAPVFFQWILLDPNVPGFLTASQAGKTVLYP